ncbi:MAG TPA: hypothetical protein VFU11_06680 [Solirubrobacterales bacterium]|nr:hypothetical protein [Solirubrobacterales bacterium]
MTRKFKSIGLALVAIFAMSALSASAASAAEFHSTSAGSTKISASQTTTHVFTSTAGEVTCEKATFTGNQTTATAASIEVTPVYSGCHIIIFGSTISATVAHNECKYKLYSNGTADIICPAGKAITVTGAGCKITVTPQTGLKSVSYTNSGTGISIAANLSGIHYHHEGFTCGTGTGTNGTYKGNTLASGTTTAGAAVTISYS